LIPNHDSIHAYFISKHTVPQHHQQDIENTLLPSETPIHSHANQLDFDRKTNLFDHTCTAVE
jgi:hypothetical protein